MTQPTIEHRVVCPYCGEAFDIQVDPSAESQHYIEDCYVCCRPIDFKLQFDPAGELSVTVRRDDD